MPAAATGDWHGAEDLNRPHPSDRIDRPATGSAPVGPAPGVEEQSTKPPRTAKPADSRAGTGTSGTANAGTAPIALRTIRTAAV